MRLLAAMHDLSGGKLGEPVPVVVPGEPGRGAAPRAGIDPDSTEDEVVLRYLVDEGYAKAVGDPATREYELTVAGLDKARQVRGLGDPQPLERGGMSDSTQKMLVTVLSIVGDPDPSPHEVHRGAGPRTPGHQRRPYGGRAQGRRPHRRPHRGLDPGPPDRREA
jgi:hypothetical protein